MIKNSRTLDQWSKELKEELKEFYNGKIKLQKELYQLTRDINNYVDEVMNSFYRELGYDKIAYREAVTYINENNELGLKMDVEHFVEKKNNGTPYQVEFRGKTLHSKWNGRTEDTYKILKTWSITEYYFHNYESKALFNVINRSSFDVEKTVNKEIDKYIASLIARIEQGYGKILKVTDSNRSNVENVLFECEEGTVYLEKILAGGYNIQRLHNRILIKRADGESI